MYEDRVRRGAQLLDEYRPGWAEEITPEDLSMSSCDRCILGQLYGDFHVGMHRLWILDPRISADVYGFTDFGLARFERALWAALADAWRAEIRARLGLEPERCP